MIGSDKRTLVVRKRPKPYVDAELASTKIQMLYDGVAVAMDPVDKQYGALEASDVGAEIFLSDFATVLAVGPDEHGIQVGDRVGLLPMVGKYLRPFTVPGFTFDGFVRMIGVNSLAAEFHERVSNSEVIVVKQVFDNLVPLHDWILIRRLDLQSEVGSLHLPDKLRYRQQMAQVIAVPERPWIRPNGSIVPIMVKPGDMIIYQATSLLVDFAFADTLGLEGDPNAYALCRQGDLHCIVKAP